MRDTGTGDGKSDTTEESQEAAGWLVVPIGAVLSAGVPYAVYFLGGLSWGDPYAQAVALYGFSAFLELLAEPFYIRAQRRSYYRLRLAAETVATLSRSFVTFYFVSSPGMSASVPLAFAFGQMAYGVCILMFYAIAQLDFAKVGVRVLVGQGNMRRGTLALIGTFSCQAIWKLLLAEGEKGVLLWVGSADAQGVYALVSSLGSLFVRIILQPFEEAAFVMFARNQSTAKPTTIKRLRSEETNMLSMLLKVAWMLGLLAAVHGPQFSQLALRLLYGKRWADAEGAAAALGGFAVMVLFLAVNGITEAFAHAVMSPPELASANLVLLISSVLNVVASVILQRRFGALGLMIANCCTMSIRICYTMRFIFVRLQV